MSVQGLADLTWSQLDVEARGRVNTRGRRGNGSEAVRERDSERGRPGREYGARGHEDTRREGEDRER